jgi:hypothetical protein
MKMTDETKLAIRDEVEKRVEQRESLYWKFGGLFAVLVVLFFTILWRVSISEIRETVEKQLAENEVVKARDRIIAINSAAEDMNRNLIAISTSMNTNQQFFMERLNQIKQQDNVVLVDDLQKMFIIQSMTNYDGRKIVLDYEPIPHTVRIRFRIEPAYAIRIDSFARLEGSTIIFTNEALGAWTNEFTSGAAQVEYVRKSIR